MLCHLREVKQEQKGFVLDELETKMLTRPLEIGSEERPNLVLWIWVLICVLRCHPIEEISF